MEYYLRFGAVIALTSLLGCDSKINNALEDPPEYLKLSGGTMAGQLNVPADSFSIGSSQFVVSGGRIGVGTSSPSSFFTVNGTIESTVGGIRFPDGSTQATAAAGTCFGGTCAGDTTYTGRASFTRVPTGSGGSNASLIVQPTAAAANNAIFSVVTSGTDKFVVDTEGDVLVAGSLSTSNNFSVGGSLSCTGCLNSTNILDGTVGSNDINGSAVLTSHISAGGSNTVLGVSSSGTVEWQNPKLQYGLKFEYLNASTIRLTPSGIDGKASVIVSNGSEIRAVVISSNLSATLTTSGAGGLDTGAEAANTGYDVYLITQSDGSSPALLYVVSGINPLLPGSYTHKSEVLWFVSNTQGAGNSDIARFVDLGNGKCRYLVNNGVRVLNDGEEVAVTVVDFTASISASTVMAQVWTEASNLDAITTTNLRFYYDSAGTLLVGTLGGLLSALVVGVMPNRSGHFNIPIHNGLSGSLYYSFSSAPVIGDFGTDIFVQEWTLASRMAR